MRLYNASSAARLKSVPDTQTAILEAARRLLESEGAHVSLEQVASAAGVSRQAVYLHFKSRANLLVALVSHISDSQQVAVKVQTALAAPSAAAALDAFVVVLSTHNAHIARAAAALDAVRRSDPAAASAWTDRMQVRRRSTRQFVERLATEGQLQAELALRDATDLVWALLSVRMWEDLTLDAGWSHAHAVRQLQRLVRNAVMKPDCAAAAHSTDT